MDEASGTKEDVRAEERSVRLMGIMKVLKFVGSDEIRKR